MDTGFSFKTNQIFVQKAAYEVISRVVVETIARDIARDKIDVRFADLPKGRPPITTFDPRNYRHPKVAIKLVFTFSPWMAYFNLLKGFSGPGVLGASMSISQVGIFGPFLTLFTGLLVVHTHMMLVWCLHEMARQLKVSSISYRYGFRMALRHGPPVLHGLGSLGPFLIALFMVMTQLATCILNILFVVGIITDIADWNCSRLVFFIMFFPFIMIQVLMKNLRIISKVNLAGNIVNIAGIIIVMYHIVDKLRDPEKIEWLPHGFNNAFVAIGTTIFNLSNVGVVLSVEKALKNPKIMTTRFGVINVGIMVPTCAAVVVGSLGYLAFGVTEDNILKSLPLDDISVVISFCFYLLFSMSNYPLQCYPCIQVIMEVIKNHDPLVVPSNRSMAVVELILRLLCVLITFLFAYFVPVQSALCAFVGIFCTILIAVVFPALMEIGLCYPDYYGRYNYILIKDVLIVTIGLICWVSGIIVLSYIVQIRLKALQGLKQTNPD